MFVFSVHESATVFRYSVSTVCAENWSQILKQSTEYRSLNYPSHVAKNYWRYKLRNPGRLSDFGEVFSVTKTVFIKLHAAPVDTLFQLLTKCHALSEKCIFFQCPINISCDYVYCFSSFITMSATFVCNPCFFHSKCWFFPGNIFIAKWSLASAAN